MRPATARLLARLYPRRWRKRYGPEFEAMLESSDGGRAAVADVVWAALREHLFPTHLIPAQGSKMEQNPLTFDVVLTRPSAFLPVMMSFTALTMVLADIAIYGVVHGGDEGAVAHLWQLLMAGQMPILLFFAVKWLPRAPRQTLYVLALQVGAACASMAPVLLLSL